MTNFPSERPDETTILADTTGRSRREERRYLHTHRGSHHSPVYVYRPLRRFGPVSFLVRWRAARAVLRACRRVATFASDVSSRLVNP
jgi:hypothetical protein